MLELKDYGHQLVYTVNNTILTKRKTSFQCLVNGRLFQSPTCSTGQGILDTGQDGTLSFHFLQGYCLLSFSIYLDILIVSKQPQSHLHEDTDTNYNVLLLLIVTMTKEKNAPASWGS